MNDERNYPDLDYAAIRKRAERRLALRLSAIMHIISIIALSPSLYNSPQWRGLEYYWFAVFALHIFYWLYSELRERAVRREIEREEQRWLLRQDGIGKRKRDDAAYRLSDDGEMEEIDPLTLQSEQRRSKVE